MISKEELLSYQSQDPFDLITTIDGYKFAFSSHNLSLGYRLCSNHQWDKYMIRRVEVLLRANGIVGGVMVNGGANIGLECVILLKNQLFDRVIAIEPHRRIFGYLQQNIQDNMLDAVVETYNVALGDQNTDISFNAMCLASNSHILQNRDDPSENLCIVKMVKLDDLLIDYDETINLLWLDIEGYEYYALKGAQRILSQCPAVYLEICPSHMARAAVEIGDLQSLLSNSGYVGFYDVRDDRVITTQRRQTWYEIKNLAEFTQPLEKRRYTDCLFLKGGNEY